MNKEGIEKLRTHARTAIASSQDEKELFGLEKRFLGRKDGELTLLLKSLKTLSLEERRTVGPLLQELKDDLARAIQERRSSLRGGLEKIVLDVTLPGIRPPQGHLHPVTQFLRRITDIFHRMGFEVADGPEVELERYNFDLLAIPREHPARDLHDTFYVADGKGLLLRTHTSPVQLRAMEKRKPPVRLISPGRVFRHEATDASHETTFTNVEGLVIDRGVRVTDLLGTLKHFFKEMFGPQIKTRFRPHYYPFVEPGMDVDMFCLFCRGKGCTICKHSGWLEMLGSGMVHPTVLKNMRVDPKKYTGFAFGFGVDRMVMLYYGIDHIRLLHSGDLRFLKQF